MPPLGGNKISFSLKPSARPAAAPATQPAPAAFNSDATQEEDASVSSARPAPLKHADQVVRDTALAQDATIFDYDGALDKIQLARQRVQASKQREKQERKPKYMASFLEKAELRQRDRERAETKMIQRAREAEGDDYQGTEAFVTDAYRAQLEQIAEQDKRDAAEERGLRQKREEAPEYREQMLRAQQEEHQALLAAVDQPDVPKEEVGGPVRKKMVVAALVAQGKQVELNEDGEVVDERQLLSTGLNVLRRPRLPSPAGTPRRETNSREPSRRPERGGPSASRRDQRARQSRLIEQQMLELEQKTQQQAQAQQVMGPSRQEKDERTAKVEAARARALERKRKRQAGAD